MSLNVPVKMSTCAVQKFASVHLKQEIHAQKFSNTYYPNYLRLFIDHINLKMLSAGRSLGTLARAKQ